jgi:hypothetical protein
MKIKRLVTGHLPDGRSAVIESGEAPREHDFVHIPGMAVAQIWSTRPGSSIGEEIVDRATTASTILPEVGGTQGMVVRFPPDAVMQSSAFQPLAAVEENLLHCPGLAERFEPDHPGMHTTDTIDYGIVLEGEIWLELADGSVSHLRQHDVVVQNGTRHAWRNRGDRPATMVFVMIGATRVEQ